MNKKSAEWKMAENEVIFRSQNEKVLKGIDDTNRKLKSENRESILFDNEAALHFYCECSDENCKKRIKMNSPDYKLIHHDRDSFIIIKNHQIKEIEKVVEKTKDYWIVEKNTTPSEKNVSSTLNKTSADNS